MDPQRRSVLENHFIIPATRSNFWSKPLRGFGPKAALETSGDIESVWSVVKELIIQGRRTIISASPFLLFLVHGSIFTKIMHKSFCKNVNIGNAVLPVATADWLSWPSGSVGPMWIVLELVLRVS